MITQAFSRAVSSLFYYYFSYFFFFGLSFSTLVLDLEVLMDLAKPKQTISTILTCDYSFIVYLFVFELKNIQIGPSA